MAHYTDDRHGALTESWIIRCFAA